MSFTIGRGRYARATYPVAKHSSGGVDEKVKVTENDTTPDYLANKIVAGQNIGLLVLNPGGDEKLEISVVGC